MAILNGLIQEMKGSAGQFTFMSLNGQTVVSEKPTKVSNPCTVICLGINFSSQTGTIDGLKAE